MEKILSASQIIILRSNVDTAADVTRLGLMMDRHTSINRWTVDLEDVDRVIRIEATGISPAEIIRLIRSLGYQCDELS